MISVVVVDILLFEVSFFLWIHILCTQVWAALGTAIVSTVGIIKFNEDFDVAKLGCLAMIVLGVIGLNLRGS